MKTFTLLLSCLISTLTFAQTTYTVDNRPGTTAQFTSVQAALDAASPGDFIYIHPSPTSYGTVSIKKEIHLRGLGHNPELANGENANISIALSIDPPNSTNASNSSFSGLNISSLTDGNQVAFTNILIQNNSITRISLFQAFNFIIQGNIINPSTNSALVFGGINHSNNIISHNIIVISSAFASIVNLVSSDTFSNNLIILNSNSASITYFNSCNNPIVNNNMFVLNTNAVATSINTTSSTINFQNCLTFAYGGQTLTSLNGANNLNNTNPQFTDIGSPENPVFAYTKNYKLEVGSPAIDAGSDGDDLGIYGQGFLFQMKGYPFDLPYPTSINITNAIVEAGGNLEVVFKASANVEN